MDALGLGLGEVLLKSENVRCLPNAEKPKQADMKRPRKDQGGNITQIITYRNSYHFREKPVAEHT